MIRKKGKGVEVIGIKLKQLGFVNYKDYLASSHWREMKKKFYASGLIKKIDGKIICWCCEQPKNDLLCSH